MDVATLVPVPNMHPRHVDLSAISACGFEQYCALVKNSAGLVTVDTSTYHVADAFSVPSVAIFLSINPDLRIRYYPTVEGILLPGSDVPGSQNGGAPRDPLRLWSRLELGKVVEMLVDQLPPD
jgi:ADP-heptose:LPS heptosyltransferase